MNQRKHTTDDEIIEANCRQNFAAARGARIQIFVAETRIHPLTNLTIVTSGTSVSLTTHCFIFFWLSSWPTRGCDDRLKTNYHRVHN